MTTVYPLAVVKCHSAHVFSMPAHSGVLKENIIAGAYSTMHAAGMLYDIKWVIVVRDNDNIIIKMTASQWQYAYINAEVHKSLTLLGCKHKFSRMSRTKKELMGL